MKDIEITFMGDNGKVLLSETMSEEYWSNLLSGKINPVDHMENTLTDVMEHKFDGSVHVEVTAIGKKGILYKLTITDTLVKRLKKNSLGDLTVTAEALWEGIKELLV